MVLACVVSDNCPGGQEYHLVNGTCEPCDIGYYRDKNSTLGPLCELCPDDNITVTTGADSVGLCIIGEQ